VVSATNAASLVSSYASFGVFFPNCCLSLCCLGCYLQGLLHLERSLLSPLVFLKSSTRFHFRTFRVQLLTHTDRSRSFLILCRLAAKLLELYVLFSVLNRLLSICLSYTVKLLVSLVLQLHLYVLAFFLDFLIMLYTLKLILICLFTCSNQRLCLK